MERLRICAFGLFDLFETAAAVSDAIVRQSEFVGQTMFCHYVAIRNMYSPGVNMQHGGDQLMLICNRVDINECESAIV